MNSYLELYYTFAKIGCFTFGGGLAMLPLLQKVICDEKHWASEEDLINYYAIGQCTPGIIAINTATFIGYKQKKIPGAILATLGFVTPSIIIITIIASLISNFSHLPIIQHALAGIRISVCVLILKAIIKLFKNGIVDIFTTCLFLATLTATYFKIASSVIIIIIAAIISIIYHQIKKSREVKA